MRQITTDVLVVGAGPAGLTAALRSAEYGHRTICIEKKNETGGAQYGGMGPFAAGSRLQKEAGLEDCSTKDAFLALMDHSKWRTDAALTSAFVNHSAEMIDWLAEEGVLFRKMDGSEPFMFGPPPAGGEDGEKPEKKPNPMGSYSHSFKMRPEYAEKCDARGMYITMLLTDRLLARENAELRLETTAERLLVSDGAVTGARCHDKDGDFEIRAKAVVLAAGGFAGSAEMVSAYTSFHLNEDLFYTHPQPNVTGDGLRMAWEVGAGKSHMMMDIYKGMPVFGGPAGTKNEWLLLSNPNLMVNRNGVRFVAEDCERYAMGNAIHAQPGGCGFMIIDSTIANEYRAAGPFIGPDNANCLADLDEIYAEAQAMGYPYVFAADSLEELCEQTGIRLEGLKQAIEDYNALCQAGEDTQFYKRSEYLKPLRSPRYYAAQYFCDSFGGLGGIKINPNTEVITERNEVIPGLFAAGSDVNSIYADTYPQHLSGNTTGFAYTTGLIASDTVHQYLTGMEDRA